MSIRPAATLDAVQVIPQTSLPHLVVSCASGRDYPTLGELQHRSQPYRVWTNYSKNAPLRFLFYMILSKCFNMASSPSSFLLPLPSVHSARRASRDGIRITIHSDTPPGPRCPLLWQIFQQL